jgi:hypothetical protein
MEKQKRKLIFDTSAINAFADDLDRKAIIEGLCIVYQVGITETVLSEIVANSEEGRRRELLDLLKRLLGCGKCILPFHWIIEAHAKEYQADQGAYEWRKLNVRFPQAENEIARQEIVHSVSDETRAHNQQTNRSYLEIFRKAKPAFDKIFEGRKERPTLKEVTEHLLAEGGAHLVIGADLVERATKTRPTEAEVKDFVKRCDPFRALLVTLCFSQYDLCIRGENVESLGKAGRLDMFSAVYTPYCAVFVTNDEGQCKAITEVARLAGLDPSVVMYPAFKESLFGLKH